jgi:MFS family permease
VLSDFHRLWAAQTVSQVGSQVTLLALPLTALTAFDAGPVEMGLLAAMEGLPWLLVGLLAGVWVDRLPRKRLLVIADVGRALLLAALSWLIVSGTGRIEALYVVALLAGCLGVFFDSGAASYLPSLVPKEALVTANSRLEVSRNAAEFGGPLLGGWLVQILTAPLALLVDAVSFGISGLLIGATRGSSVSRSKAASSMAAEIAEGIRVVARHPLLRATAITSGTFNFFDGMLFSALYLLYATQYLGLSAAAIGVLFSVGSLGGLAGALIAERVTARFGIGSTVAASAIVAGAGSLLIPFAGVAGLTAAAVLALAEVLVRGSAAVFGVNSISLRQAVTPDHLLGRVSATVRVISWGAMPVGALLGGALGELLGVPLTMGLAAAGTLLAGVWLVGTPLRSYGSSDHPAG